MAEKMNAVVQYHAKRLKPAVGSKIVKIIVEDMDGEYVVGFVLEKDGKQFEITAMADAEGNYAGWMTFDEVTDDQPRPDEIQGGGK